MMRLLILAMVAALPILPASAADFTPSLEGVIVNYIRPAMSDFADTAARLPATVSSVCETGDDKAIAAFRSAYSDSLQDFARIQFLRFGPLLDDDRLSRLAFLPDPRGIAQRQIRKIYAEQDAGVTSPESLKGKSVAVQGLAALELIAFDKNGKVVLGGAGERKDFICAYAQAIAQNLSLTAADLAAAWADPDDFSAVLLASDSGNDRFYSSKEAVETVFNALVTGLIITMDQDIETAVGPSKEKAKANRFPFSRSANSIAYLSGEIQGVHDALVSLDLKSLTPDDYLWIFDTLDFETGNALALLGKLQPLLRKTFGEGESYERAGVLLITLRSIRDTMAEELAGALELAGGFNSLDGD